MEKPLITLIARIYARGNAFIRESWENREIGGYFSGSCYVKTIPSPSFGSALSCLGRWQNCFSSNLTP